VVISPLIVDIEAEVPIWLAVELKAKKKCKIILPDWLDPGNEKFDFRKIGTVLADKTLSPLNESKIQIDAILPMLI
jgi:hypothetical protein